MCCQGNSYLERLGIHPDVRSFFQPYIDNRVDEIIFSHGEHVSDHFHRVPITEDSWIAGELNIANQILICGSAMDAIAWLHFHHNSLQNQNPFFLAVGASPSKTPFENLNFKNKSCRLISGNDDLGAIFDLKVASFVRNKPLKIIAHDHQFVINFKSKNFNLKHLSLNALEKASRFHFNIPVSKPKQFNTFYDQLKNRDPG